MRDAGWLEAEAHRWRAQVRMAWTLIGLVLCAGLWLAAWAVQGAGR